MLRAGAQHGQPLPLSELHASVLETLVERGLGDADNSAVIRAWFEV